MLSARPRSCAGKSAWTEARACGAIAAAASACSSRAAISADGDQASPQKRRGEGEPGKADHKDRLAAENVAEPAAGDQEHRIDDRIARDDELHLGRRGAQARRYRRHRDVDDEEIQRRQKSASEQHRQRRPAARDRAVRSVGARQRLAVIVEILALLNDRFRIRPVFRPGRAASVSTTSAISCSLGPVLPSTRRPWIVQSNMRAIARSSRSRGISPAGLAADDGGGEQILHAPEHPRDQRADFDVVRHHLHRRRRDQTALLPLRRRGAPGIAQKRLANGRRAESPAGSARRRPAAATRRCNGRAPPETASACRGRPCRGCRAQARCPR